MLYNLDRGVRYPSHVGHHDPAIQLMGLMRCRMSHVPACIVCIACTVTLDQLSGPTNTNPDSISCRLIHPARVLSLSL